MPIDLYSMPMSPYCRSVLMLAKELNLDLNVKNVAVTEGQQFSEEYLKMNPAHSIPTLVNNGFVLWESRAILRYLCNKFAPDSTLYPKDPEKRAVVDRWLDFDLVLEKTAKPALWGKMLLGVEPTPEKMTAFTNNLKLMNQLIGDNKFLTGDQLTIADLSMIALNGRLSQAYDLKPYPNIERWIATVSSELPYFSEVNFVVPPDQMKAFLSSPEAQNYFKRKIHE